MYLYLINNLNSIVKQLSGAARLLVVSKNQPVEKITPLLDAGHREFAENRMQEVSQKWRALKLRYPGVKLHFIGHLQSNKVKDAVALCDVIQTVDRLSLAEALIKEMQRSDHFPECYVQVNTGGEQQKSGISLEEAENFIAMCRDRLKLPITGLMCIPPADEDPAVHFALLQGIARRLGLKILSMGMSNDYEVALNYGATYIRIGRGIFEERI